MACTTTSLLYTIAQVCSWTGFGLNIAAFAGSSWVEIADGTESLFSRCNKSTGTNLCDGIAVGAFPWLDATRAMLCIAIIVNSTGNGMLAAGYGRRMRKLGSAGVGLIYLAALFITIGMVVYTAEKADDGYPWGYAYGLGWAAMGLLNLAGGVALATLHMQHKDGGYETK